VSIVLNPSQMPASQPNNVDDKINQLPSSRQVWAHSTTDKLSLSKALENPLITAIESDIVLGTCNDDEEEVLIGERIQPIMAHPPSKTSDLSFKKFLEMSTYDSKISSKEMKKHLKLDFKEIDAVEPVLQNVKDMDVCQSHGKTIFLNADILPGPGSKTPAIDADVFIETCINTLGNSHEYCAYSIGWKVDCRSFSGYSATEVEAMKSIILRHNLLQSRGVILPVCARLLAKNCSVFDSILQDLPAIQLLVWTGSGEPPISMKAINSIKSYFNSTVYADRVGFDCKVASSSVSGFFYDFAVKVAAIFCNCF